MPALKPVSERSRRRIADLSVLPVFMRVRDRPVLAVGGTSAMAWKLDLLLAAGARPVLVDDKSHDDIAALSGQPGMTIRSDLPSLDTLGRFALVIVDTADQALARRLYDAAVSCGVPINQIDRPNLCTVQFGSIVNRSPAIVSISTDGNAPVLAQAIRQRIESALPQNLGAWAELAGRWRARVKQEFPLLSRRRAWWQSFSGAALAGKRPPEPHARLSEADASTGQVTLVGAGPGDPDLLTVKAIRALQNADVVLFDALVSDGVLELARREARRMPVGKRGNRPSCKQDEINRLMISFARQGKNVVRLKGGDPAIFSRGGEEARVLTDLGIRVSVVPGITVASAAAAGLGITLTDREFGRQLRFVSGHGRDGEAVAIDWSAVGSHKETVALYMARSRLPVLARQALACGVAPETPLSCGTRISRDDEDWHHTTIGRVARNILPAFSNGPTLVLIGQVLATRSGAKGGVSEGAERALAG